MHDIIQPQSDWQFQIKGSTKGAVITSGGIFPLKTQKVLENQGLLVVQNKMKICVSNQPHFFTITYYFQKIPVFQKLLFVRSCLKNKSDSSLK